MKKTQQDSNNNCKKKRTKKQEKSIKRLIIQRRELKFNHFMSKKAKITQGRRRKSPNDDMLIKNSTVLQLVFSPRWGLNTRPKLSALAAASAPLLNFSQCFQSSAFLRISAVSSFPHFPHSNQRERNAEKKCLQNSLNRAS